MRRSPLLFGGLRNALLRGLPQGGYRRATFGRGRVITCDLGVGYDRSVYAGCEEVTEVRLVQKSLFPAIILLTAERTLASSRSSPPFACAHLAVCLRSNLFRPPSLASARCPRGKVDSYVLLFDKALAERSDDLVTSSGEHHNVMQVQRDRVDGGVVASTVALDDIIPRHLQITGLKLDVEGQEAHVVRGGQATIERCSPWMIIEMNSDIAGVRLLGTGMYTSCYQVSAIRRICRRPSCAVISILCLKRGSIRTIM